MLSGAKHLWLSENCGQTNPRFFASLRMTAVIKEKPESKCRFGFLKFYPAGAVQVILPFPFRKGWMTVAAESDFQSRPVIFRTNQASVFRQLSVRGRHLNREHRRANVYIPKRFGTRKPLAES